MKLNLIEFRALILDTAKVWLDKGRIGKTVYNTIAASFEEEDLKIGIIGKMKAGKSTLVNAVVFENSILPTSTAPTTVTLTEICYGEQEKVTVSFLSAQDIDELRQKKEEEGESSQVAKELYEKITKIPDYEAKLSKTIDISLAQLPNFVSAEGEYSGLAKSVKIIAKNDKLKGLTIIDTPGFNDPVISRYETTRHALKDCHILLFIQEPFSIFDRAEIHLLEEQVAFAGISKMINIINRIDMVDEPINQWNKYVDIAIKKKNEIAENTLNKVLREILQSCNSLYLSSWMALLGYIDKNKQSMNELMKRDYIYFMEDFPVLQKSDDFIHYSNMEVLAKEFNTLTQEKSKILLDNPLKTLLGQLQYCRKIIESEIESKEKELLLYQSQYTNLQELVNLFEEFMVLFISEFHNSSIEATLNAETASVLSELKQLRSRNASGQFTEKKYPDPRFGDTGVKKKNLSNFSIFVLNTNDEIRDKLDTLTREFISKSNAEIDNIILRLRKKSTRFEGLKEHFDNLGQILKTHISHICHNNPVPISITAPKSMPTGKLQQYALYANAYNDLYSDNALKDIIDSFGGKAEAIKSGSTMLVTTEINRIGNNFRKMNDPQQQQQLLKDIEKEIETKKKEQDSLTEDINKLHETQNQIQW